MFSLALSPMSQTQSYSHMPMTRWGHSFANALPWRSRPIMAPLLSLAYGILSGKGVAGLFIIGYNKAWSCQLVIKDNNDPERTITSSGNETQTYAA